jgi:hypothetical protein
MGAGLVAGAVFGAVLAGFVSSVPLNHPRLGFAGAAVSTATGFGLMTSSK